MLNESNQSDTLSQKIYDPGKLLSIRNFPWKVEADGVKVEYLGLGEIGMGSPWVGALHVNGERVRVTGALTFSGFTGPTIITPDWVYCTVYLKGKFLLSRVEIATRVVSYVHMEPTYFLWPARLEGNILHYGIGDTSEEYASVDVNQVDWKEAVMEPIKNQHLGKSALRFFGMIALMIGLGIPLLRLALGLPLVALGVVVVLVLVVWPFERQ